MSRKPENTFRASIHRHLPVEHPYHEKMNNPYRSGTPDDWYSGMEADLWVEYKFIVMPKRDTTEVLPELSDAQLDWLHKRHGEGRNVAVIVGCRDGGVIYEDLSWVRPMTAAQFRRKLISRKSLAQWLWAKTMGDRCVPESTASCREDSRNTAQDDFRSSGGRVDRIRLVRLR